MNTMNRTVLLALLAAIALPAAAQVHPAQRYVDQLAAEEPLHSAAWGVVAKDARGKVLVSLNPDQKLVPASNMKLVTTGCALHALGSSYRFETKLGYSGEIRDGALEGDLYIIGGGDPTLATADTIVMKTSALFWKWKTALRSAGIHAIHGRVIGDGRLFQGNLENSSWEYNDLGTYYGAGGNGLSFYANAQDFSVSAGTKAGDPVRVAVKYPQTPWMHFAFRGTTEAAGTGNSLYMYTTDLAPYAEMRGTFALDRKPKTEHFANKFGAMTCAYYFWKSLTDSGWEVSGGYADIDRGGYIRGADFVPAQLATDTLRVIGSTWSPTLDLIARETNCRSDNFYAETLLRTIGLRETGHVVYDSCQVAEKRVLERLAADLSQGIVIEDGSGLSRHNHLSPDFFVRHLTAMRTSPAFPSFLASLPQPGGNGTLKGVLRDEPEEVKARIRMKSGSMTGVLCYSGYILPADWDPAKPAKGNIITFSIMTNNCDAPASEVREKITKIVSLLAK